MQVRIPCCFPSQPRLFTDLLSHDGVDLSLDGGWLTLRAYLSETEREEVEKKVRRARVIKCASPVTQI
jgi:hypothetical protein